MSIKNLVKKTISRTVDKHVDITPDMVAGLLKKAVGAPEETPLNTAIAADGITTFYVLDWKETPKSRAPRKAKAKVVA